MTTDAKTAATICLALSLVFHAPMAAAAAPGAREARDIPELECVVEPSEIVDVGSAVPGVIERIHVDRGDLVARGAAVAELESGVERAAAELARYRSELTTGIELRREGAAFGMRQQSRNQELYKRRAIALNEIDELKTETRVAQLQLRQEEENKHIAGLDYRRAQEALERRTIRSPVDGVVMERFKSVGEYVDDTPVMRIAQLDPLHVEVIVPTELMGRISVGMRADVVLEHPGRDGHPAEVVRVDLVADAASSTFGARLSLPNPGYEIPAGLRCRLAFVPGGGIETSTMTETVELARRSPVAARGQAEDFTVPTPTVSPLEVTVDSAPVGDAQPIEAEVPASLNDVTAEALPSVASTASNSPDFPTCYTIGPLSDSVLVDQLAHALTASAAGLAVREETTQTERDYLVLAQAQPSRQATRALLERLEAAGVEDFFVLPQRDYDGRVSLGLFRDRKNAHGYQSALAAKGFETDVVPRYRETPAFSLDVRLDHEGVEAGTVRDVVTRLAPDAPFEATTCSEVLARQ